MGKVHVTNAKLAAVSQQLNNQACWYISGYLLIRSQEISGEDCILQQNWDYNILVEPHAWKQNLTVTFNFQSQTRPFSATWKDVQAISLMNAKLHAKIPNKSHQHGRIHQSQMFINMWCVTCGSTCTKLLCCLHLDWQSNNLYRKLLRQMLIDNRSVSQETNKCTVW